jgi:hypothetical protein
VGAIHRIGYRHAQPRLIMAKRKVALKRSTPTSPDKWSAAVAEAKAKFKVYPSAYANAWAAKRYKAMGGGWKGSNNKVS